MISSDLTGSRTARCRVAGVAPADRTHETDEILRLVHRSAGVDFSAYRPQTIERRIRNRMAALGLDDLADYRHRLEQSPPEVQRLIERLTIKVSRFYRDPLVFDAIRWAALPRLARLERPVRVWSAGCGRGEEAYTLAMLMDEATIPGEVIATDLDPLALAFARGAVYDEAAVTDLPPLLAAGCLERAGPGAARVEVVERVRRRVTFKQADLTADERIEPDRFDLVCCRNVLIYWRAAAQRTILGRVVSALRPGGWLCLGEAEWPEPAAASRLDVVSARLRLFRHTVGGPGR